MNGTSESTPELGLAVRLRPPEIANPVSGELVLAADAPKVLTMLRALKDYRDELMGAIRLCEEALVEESRLRGSKTLRFDGVGVATISGGSELLWDVEILGELLEAGLPPDRYNELVRETVEYKVNASVAKQIEASNPDYAAIIARARGRVEKKARVSV